MLEQVQNNFELFWGHFGIIILGLFHWGNQVRIIGGTRLVWRGTADPLKHNTILYPNCKNPKGKPGWGKNATGHVLLDTECNDYLFSSLLGRSGDQFARIRTTW